VVERGGAAFLARRRGRRRRLRQRGRGHDQDKGCGEQGGFEHRGYMRPAGGLWQGVVYPSFSKAAATISAKPSVVLRPVISSGRSQRASASSSLRTGSPAIQRAAKARITKWRSTLPAASRTITSRCPASATGSTGGPVSSLISRISAPRRGSTPPP